MSRAHLPAPPPFAIPAPRHPLSFRRTELATVFAYTSLADWTVLDDDPAGRPHLRGACAGEAGARVVLVGRGHGRSASKSTDQRQGCDIRAGQGRLHGGLGRLQRVIAADHLKRISTPGDLPCKRRMKVLQPRRGPDTQTVAPLAYYAEHAEGADHAGGRQPALQYRKPSLRLAAGPCRHACERSTDRSPRRRNWHEHHQRNSGPTASIAARWRPVS
jgi:hypothetical protein